jgi:alkylation response protein AidB-like acyl-CoA dehydrogenase
MDRQEIQDSARQAFGSGGLVPDAAQSWATLVEMGWFMMTVPEAQGGLGLGGDALAAIHYELGRALVPGPAMAQMLVIEAFAASGEDELLARAMAGEVMTASLSPSPPGAGLRWGSSIPPPPQTPPQEGRGLNALPDADLAQHALSLAGDRITLAPIISVTHRPTWDETHRLFDVMASDDGVVLATGSDAATLAGRLQSHLCLMLAADSLGGADAVLAMTIDYLKTRRQFDRPIAMFQALKHRVADLKIALAGAEALLWSRAANDSATLAQLGALKAHACRSYRLIAEEAIQLHGGIGLTAEYPCHLFLKRAMLNCALGGDSDAWEEMTGRAALAAV